MQRAIALLAVLLLVSGVCAGMGSAGAPEPAPPVGEYHGRWGCMLTVLPDSTFAMENECSSNAGRMFTGYLNSAQEFVQKKSGGATTSGNFLELRFFRGDDKKILPSAEPDLRLAILHCGKNTRLVEPEDFDGIAAEFNANASAGTVRYKQGFGQVDYDTHCDLSPLMQETRALENAPPIETTIRDVVKLDCEREDREETCDFTATLVAGAASGVRKRMQWYFPNCGHGEIRASVDSVDAGSATLSGFLWSTDGSSRSRIRPGERVTNRVPACLVAALKASEKH